MDVSTAQNGTDSVDNNPCHTCTRALLVLVMRMVVGVSVVVVVDVEADGMSCFSSCCLELRIGQ